MKLTTKVFCPLPYLPWNYKSHANCYSYHFLSVGLKSISSSAGLSSLKLGICLNITDRGLSYVGKCCSKLKELDLYRFVLEVYELLHFAVLVMWLIYNVVFEAFSNDFEITTLVMVHA